MSFNGTEGSLIPMSEASALTDKFKQEHPDTTKGGFLGKEKLLELLDQNGAVGLRIYNGQDANGNVVPVVVAADSNEDDILDKILDQSKPCPTRCSTPNPLNR